ncbi:hypothetical protein MP228_009066 [Amoeboaphelidium protococcarum]|nr:hypothetical protein MP228_009066 [Amoeboaphelidium protococcarum]
MSMNKTEYFDAHVHPQHQHLKIGHDSSCDDITRQDVDATVKQINQFLTANTGYRMMVMGTQPSDWSIVERIYLQNSDQVVPCFGYHPWFAFQLQFNHKNDKLESLKQQQLESQDRKDQSVVRDNWFQQLEQMLQKYPNAVVGEFGLDKIAKTPSHLMKIHPGVEQSTFKSIQQVIFDQQIHLAWKLNRPVSLHCVQSHEEMLAYFKSKVPSKRSLVRQYGEDEAMLPYTLQQEIKLPPRIMLHSYMGPPQFIEKFCQLPMGVGARFYFSYSSTICGRSMQRLQDSIRNTPSDRLLAETDLGSVDSGLIDAMKDILNVIAQVKSISYDDARQMTIENAIKFQKGDVQ